MKIGLERVNTQEGITVEVLLDSSITKLVISLEFARKQGFRLKKIDKPIYVRNVDSSFNKEELIVSKIKVVDLIHFHFLFYFHFSFDLFFIFLFLELGLG